MLKNIFNKVKDVDKDIFPKVETTVVTNMKSSTLEDPVSHAIEQFISNQSDDSKLMLMINNILSSSKFIEQFTDVVTNKLLIILRSQYDFEPTNKYLEQIEDKKRYINQLDTYLQERREINNTVESELQFFLQETTNNLSKALEGFTLSIERRIKDAESKHGIDIIKNSLLNVESKV